MRILLCLLLSGCAIFDEPAKFEIKRTENFQTQEQVIAPEVKKESVKEEEILPPTPFKTGRKINPPPACVEARKNVNPC